ncbi:MAG TPA: glycoside hydrolase family 25, partial [Lachnospiraceae bacterium]|nr:glycoside hydrolase family 25 [Lachnospiraceae bacterium]
KEEVTAKEKANLRSEPGTDREDTIKEVLLYGDVAVRTGIGDNGWSKVEYKGQVLYALSKYLTTNLKYQEKAKPSKDNPESGIHFTEVNEKVTAKEVTNLRLVPSTEAEDTVAAVLHNGDIAVRTGIGDNGW